MPEPLAQINPPDVGLDLSGLADAIWHSFLKQLPDIGQAIWTPFTEWLTNGIQQSSVAIWDTSFVAMSTLLFQMPTALTTNLPAYQAIAANPVLIAVGGSTLAVVMLGLRTILGAIVGRDHVLTHITGRLIPATACAASYTFIVGWALGQINTLALAIGETALGNMMRFPGAPPNPFLLPVYLLLWILLLWYGVKLLVRVAYGLLRFVVALLFGPAAIILWAIPQTEWVTSFWLREFIGWGLTPVFVATALAIAIPLALGQVGFIGAALFAIAGFKAAYDLVGLFAMSKGSGGGGLGASPFALARLAAVAATGGGAAAAAIPPNRVTTVADQYGYQ